MSCPNLSLDNDGNTTSDLQDTQSAEELQAIAIQYYFMNIGIPVVCSFGIVGNILNLLVLTKEKRQRTLTKMELSAHMGLIALAFSDFMFCLLALLFVMLPLKGVYVLGDALIYYDWLGGGFITMFIVTSTWLIVVMAGERYMAVCHPFKARNLISLRRTRISITAIFVGCAFCTIPIFMQTRIQHFQCADNVTYLHVIERSMFTRKVVAARRLMWSVLFDFIPCAALIYFNICLIWKIHHAKRMRRNMAPMQCHEQSSLYSANKNGTLSTSVSFKRSPGQISYKPSCSVELESQSYNSSPHQTKMARHISRKRSTDSALNSVTATLVAVVIMFLILVSPSELLKFVLNYTTDSQQYKVKIVNAITNFMQALNFSTNFVLYCVINKSFRETLTSIFSTVYCRKMLQSREEHLILERSG
ncbi:cholecystokinin receptor-like [Haliotis cracherodii]|uniref:cholecystokinin receptor-like n=1 Tax=Haliotis cracherodii TaxID=6455 RepID=UPI0039EAD972